MRTRLLMDDDGTQHDMDDRLDTLPETNIAMENPPFWWHLSGNMGLFHGYVSFREDNRYSFLVWIKGNSCVHVVQSPWCRGEMNKNLVSSWNRNWLIGISISAAISHKTNVTVVKLIHYVNQPTRILRGILLIACNEMHPLQMSAFHPKIHNNLTRMLHPEIIHYSWNWNEPWDEKSMCENHKVLIITHLTHAGCSSRNKPSYQIFGSSQTHHNLTESESLSIQINF